MLTLVGTLTSNRNVNVRLQLPVKTANKIAMAIAFATK
jgi:hypothetical protein